MNSKKITIVTPVLCPSENVLKVLTACMKSIQIARNKVKAEWIIVDDASDVGSTFFQSLADIYIKNQTVQGVSRSMNLGIKLSSGDLVIKLDSDYLVPENLLEVLLQDWTDDLCFLAPSYNHGRKLITIGLGGVEDKPHGENNKYKLPWGGGIIMMSKKVLEEVDYFDEGFGVGRAQDNDLLYRMIMKGYNWRRTNNVAACHFASVSCTDPKAPHSRSKRVEIGKEYFIKKHNFPPGGIFQQANTLLKKKI